jgi:hypothetical protein
VELDRLSLSLSLSLSLCALPVALIGTKHILEWRLYKTNWLPQINFFKPHYFMPLRFLVMVMNRCVHLMPYYYYFFPQK